MTTPQTVRLTLRDLPGERVAITSTFAPMLGASASPAQALAMDIANQGRKRGHQVHHADADPLAAFVARLLHPDELGWAVTGEVRDHARWALDEHGAAALPACGEARPPKVYISGPMTDVPQLNHPAFNLAAQALRSAGWAVFNPAENGMPPEAPWAEHMRVDIAQLTRCTHVATLEGWQSSRGAVLEVHIANRLGLQVSTLQHLITLGATRVRAQEATA